MPMNIEMICWYLALLLGASGFLCGIVFLLLKKGIREEHFARAAVFEFAASWILYIPEELFNDIPDSLPLLKVVESIFTALLRSFNIYLGNDYRRVVYEGHPVFSGIYATLMTVTNIVLLLFVAGFIIKFFDGPFQRILLSLRKRRSTFIFSVCNEKTLAIASSIKEPKKNIVFACCGRNLEPAWKERIVALKGIRIDGTVSDALNKVIRSSAKLEVFLFGDKEEDNLSELENVCRYAEAFPGAKIRVYVELSETPWNLYDEYLKTHNSANGEHLVINFVRTEENFVYNNLLKNSIFENALTDGSGQSREIKFLLVGMNDRNLEMFKAVLHLSQMPGYRLTIMVLDPGSGRSGLKRRFPEIYDECDKVGDAVYRILYKENVELESDQFESIISEQYSDFSFAFVNAGDDLLNANLAMRLNALCFRRKRPNDYRIQVNIKNEEICEKWNPKLLQQIDIVGSLKETYAYSFITMSDIEKGTIAIHRVRYPTGKPTWISYCNDEYRRHSVYARTLSFKYKRQLIEQFHGADYRITSTDKTWKVYEHMRWNVYTRTLGYVLAKKELLNEDGELDRTLRGIAKVHNDLVDFEELPEKEQAKDVLKLTDEVVAILKEI